MLPYLPLGTAHASHSQHDTVKKTDKKKASMRLGK